MSYWWKEGRYWRECDRAAAEDAGRAAGKSERDAELEQRRRQEDADETADCEDHVGQKVVVMGYGSY